MKKIALLILSLVPPAAAGMIFDNGSGNKNDTLVIQFCQLDSSGQRYATWDTAYIVQSFGGVDFNIDTLTSPGSYDLNGLYPRNLMFEYRLRAANSGGDIGVYTYWALMVDGNNGTDSHHMHKGWYYVNEDPLEEILVSADTSVNGALGNSLREAVGDSIPSIADNILAQPSNKLATNASGYVTLAGAADGAIDSADFAVAFFRAVKRYFWTDIITDYNPNQDEAHTFLKNIFNFTDGNGADGIDEDMGNPSEDANPTRLAWATDDSLGSGSVPDSVIARVDSIRWAVGMPMSISGEKYQDNLHKKTGSYSGLPGDNNNIRDDIAGLSLTGSGSESCTLAVMQSGGGPIFGARIIIRTLDQTATRVPGLFTDTNGQGIAELDAASYFLSLAANNYVPMTDTLIVFRDSLWTFNMIPFDPGAPVSPDLCRVYGWVFDITGESLSDVVVTAEIPAEYQPIKYGNVVITPFEKGAISDSTGYWEIDLFPNGVLSDTTSKYLFTIEYPSGVIMRSETAVPDSVSWEFR